MTTELKPCPFCGGEGEDRRDVRSGYENNLDDRYPYFYYVECGMCKATGGRKVGGADAARQAWNRRWTDDTSH